MFHLKGYRIGLPAIQRFGILNYNRSMPVKRNRHPGLEIHFVLKGEVTWELEHDLKPLRISGGSFSVIPANCEHRALGDNGEPARRLGIIFEANAAHKTDGTPFSSADLRRILTRFAENSRQIHRLTPKMANQIGSIMKSASITTIAEPDGQLQLRILLSELMHETYLALAEPNRLSPGQDVIPKIRQWIEEHLSESISIERLVSISGYGRSRFFSLFLTNTGMTPNDYILRQRIKRAKRELGSRRFGGTISDLAFSYGFNSIAAFSKTFRKQTGLSPREFRNLEK